MYIYICTYVNINILFYFVSFARMNCLYKKKYIYICIISTHVLFLYRVVLQVALEKHVFFLLYLLQLIN